MDLPVGIRTSASKYTALASRCPSPRVDIYNMNDQAESESAKHSQSKQHAHWLSSLASSNARACRKTDNSLHAQWQHLLIECNGRQREPFKRARMVVPGRLRKSIEPARCGCRHCWCSCMQLQQVSQNLSWPVPRHLSYGVKASLCSFGYRCALQT